jgi:peptidoglycan/LPS O-acetylase OafA/YrhL
MRNAAAFPGFFLFYIAATFALAYFAYYKFELPVQQFLRGRVHSPKAIVQLEPSTTPG